MPDRDNVIKRLEECLSASCRGFRTCPYSDNEWDAVKTALTLLREQEPVEPTAEDEAIRVKYNCGGCGYLVGFVSTIHDDMQYRAKFCPECGRRIEWDE